MFCEIFYRILNCRFVLILDFNAELKIYELMVKCSGVVISTE